MTQSARTLNQTFALLLSGAIVPLLIGALVLLYYQGRQEQRNGQRQLSVVAQTLVEGVEREFELARRQLEVIAASPLVDAKDMRLLYEFAKQVASREPGNVIGLAGPDGQQVFNTATEFGSPQPNLWRLGSARREAVWEGRKIPLSSQNLTKEVFERGEPAYSDLYFGLNTQRPAMAVSIPVKRDGVVLYALTMSFQPARLQELVSASVSAPGMRAAVTDRLGRVVASNAAAASRLADVVTPIPPQAASPSGQGTYEITSRDGVALRGAYATVKNGYVVRVSRPAETFSGFLVERVAGLAALVLVALLISGFASMRLARRIARPLRALEEAARTGSAPPATGTGIRELDVLATALRAGTQAEQERREALVLEVQRRETEENLKRADRQKDIFLATLAHELRNPLAPIRTASHLLRLSAPADEKVQRAREVIERQVAHMARLVDDLLDISKITFGMVQLSSAPCDLVALTRTACDALRPVMAAAGLHFEDQLPGHGIRVNGDAVRLSQCISNVLTNAMKFTPNGGQVRLTLVQQDSFAEISVADSGIGIDRDALERVFLLFAQEQVSGLSGNSGLGIGLALTRKLIEMHGGTVTAHSDGAGCGSTFRIRLPVAAQHDPAGGGMQGAREAATPEAATPA